MAASEEPVESDARPEGASVQPGQMEHPDGAGLLPQGIFPVVLGLPAALAGRGAPSEVDELGHAVALRAVQEIRAAAEIPPRRHPAMDPAAPVQRSGGGDEQQGQVDQPQSVWIPEREVLHRQYLSLLRKTATSC